MTSRDPMTSQWWHCGLNASSSRVLVGIRPSSNTMVNYVFVHTDSWSNVMMSVMASWKLSEVRVWSIGL